MNNTLLYYDKLIIMDRQLVHSRVHCRFMSMLSINFGYITLQAVNFCQLTLQPVCLHTVIHSFLQCTHTCIMYVHTCISYRRMTEGSQYNSYLHPHHTTPLHGSPLQAQALGICMCIKCPQPCHVVIYIRVLPTATCIIVMSHTFCK